MANTRTSREERAINGRIGGIKSQTLEFQAQRIVKHWPELTSAQQRQIRTLLRPVCGGWQRLMKATNPGLPLPRARGEDQIISNDHSDSTADLGHNGSSNGTSTQTPQDIREALDHARGSFRQACRCSSHPQPTMI